jgi:hypothetical protein
MKNKDFQNGLIVGMVSGGVVEVEDTTKIDNLETLIDSSGVLEDAEGTVMEKVQNLIDLIKEYQKDSPETIVPENVLKSLEGYLLKDKDGLYLIPKESE